MEERWEDTRTRVLERDQHRCSGRFLGGECSAVLDVHHIVPRSEGGTDELDNLLTLCHKHHPMLEAIRRAIRSRRDEWEWKRCPHRPGTHRYGKQECERQLNWRTWRRKWREAA
jgi:hypothetical protein